LSIFLFLLPIILTKSWYFCHGVSDLLFCKSGRRKAYEKPEEKKKKMINKFVVKDRLMQYD
jgi:hypothetical protein